MSAYVLESGLSRTQPKGIKMIQLNRSHLGQKCPRCSLRLITERSIAQSSRVRLDVPWCELCIRNKLAILVNEEQEKRKRMAPAKEIDLSTAPPEIKEALDIAMGIKRPETQRNLSSRGPHAELPVRSNEVDQQELITILAVGREDIAALRTAGVLHARVIGDRADSRAYPIEELGFILSLLENRTLEQTGVREATREKLMQRRSALVYRIRRFLQVRGGPI